MKIYLKILETLYKVIRIIIIALFVAMTAVMTLQIFGRYLFDKGWHWTDEFTRYANIYCIYLGASLVLFHNDHINVNFMDGFIPKKFHRWLNTFRSLIATIFTGVMTYFSPEIIKAGASSTSPNMALPLHLVYLIFPVAFALMFLYSLFNTISFAANIPNPHWKSNVVEDDDKNEKGVDAE